MRYFKEAATFVVMAALLSGCAATRNDNLNSMLWIQSSAEYKANSLQTYDAAEKNIDSALNNSSWTAALEQEGDFSMLPVAVIMDIDETVLDSSKYQAKLVIDDTKWNADTWDEWVALKDAPAIPGAVGFIQALKKRNIEVIYISNRECRPREGRDGKCPQEQDTIDNLSKVGIDGVNPEDIFLQNEKPEWSSEKKNRREAVTAKYRILMIIGDDLGDFMPNVKKDITPLERDELVLQHRSNWGRKWFMLSNPAYGSWFKILEEPKLKYLIGY